MQIKPRAFSNVPQGNTDKKYHTLFLSCEYKYAPKKSESDLDWSFQMYASIVLPNVRKMMTLDTCLTSVKAKKMP